MSVKRSTTIPANIFWLASLLFFISGGTGLVYQVVWFKRFSHVWGSTSLAFAAVGASFLFGLGLGAFLLGRFSDRVVVPLKWYGVSELLIGGLALVIPFQIAALVNASAGLFARIPEQMLLRFLVQSSITLSVIGLPCVLMGGTLPLLIRQLTAREGSLDQATGWLYAINTFGAAVGCYLAGFHFLPSIGLFWTNNLAAAVNITIGVIAIMVSGSAEQRLSTSTKVPMAADAVPKRRWSMALFGLYVATTLSGCAALVLEMTWTRQLALVLGGSTYALTATLFVVLVGIALGSLIFHFGLQRVASSPLVPVAVVAILVVTTVVGKLLLPSLSMMAGAQAVRMMRGDPFANGAICAGISALLEFLPAVCMGILFPLFVHLTHASAARVGSAVGNIYAWNTAGSIVGASLTAVLLFPRIGTGGAVALATAMYVVALLAVIPWRGWRAMVTGGVVAAAGAGVVLWILQATDPRATNLGFYLYGHEVKPGNSTDNNAWMAFDSPLYFREGASCNVFVGRGNTGYLQLRVNGKIDASNDADMVTQLGLAYFPRIFKHDAKEVLVIGFGSGCTSGRSLLFPGTRVTCCEIEPAVYEASEQFASFNGRPHEKSRAWLEARNAELLPDKRLTPEEIDQRSRFSVIFGDGRTAIQGSSQKYDLIISEPSNPWLAGVSNLFTKEFFRSAREHLTEGGVLAQWIQTYGFTLSDYLMIVRTLRSEFPHYGVLMLLGGGDTVLLASEQPVLPKLETIMALQETVDSTKEISDDLRTWFGGTDLRWLIWQHYLIGEEQLNVLVDKDKSTALNTDLNLRLEFDAPLHLFQAVPQEETATVGLLGARDPKWVKQLATQLDANIHAPQFQLTQGMYLIRQAAHPALARPLRSLGQLDRGASHFEAALALDPKLADAQFGLARVRWMQARYDDAIKVLTNLLELAPNDAMAHGFIAQVFYENKQFDEATKHFRSALRLESKRALDNRSILWANYLAWILATSPNDKLRNGAEAVRWAKAVCEASEFKDPRMLDTLAAAYAEAGDFIQAIKVAQKAIELAADQAALIDAVRDRLKLYQASQSFREYVAGDSVSQARH